MSKIMLVTNEDTGHYLHRLPLARALRHDGHEVILVCPFTQYKEQLLQDGFRCIEWNLSRKSLNPFKELFSVFALSRIYRKEKPAAVQHFTIKPILYGSIAALLSNKPKVINTFTGVSFPFTDSKFSKRFRLIVSVLLKKLLQNKSSHTIFHNPDDQEMLIRHKIISKQNSSVILGGGVDTTKFQPRERGYNPIPVVLMASRLIQEKGIQEYAEAANILSSSDIKAEFWHIGGDDEGSLLSITQEEKISYASAVDFKGHVDDMPSILNKVDIAVLPSYHEGLSRFLLESASSGLPIVATEVGGCKYITKDGVNGFLVPPQDSHALAACIKTLVQDPILRNQMGRESRQIAVEEFEESFITNQYLNVLNKLINQ
ncbi:MAG: hypothetical protein CL763_03310 [Chloroflexi bacterium]|nr:hypothetical protein [Chloroflexota bacterium]|tara:strand:- start:15767 stop:16885 length:1119 start_codon:yes stop_codon:yes gene_type:complete